MAKFNSVITGNLLSSLQKVLPTRVVLPRGGSPDKIQFIVPEVREAKLEIFSDEHPPPHFRVSYGGESANFSLYDGTRLRKNRAIRIKDRQIFTWWKEHRVAMAELWNRTRPADCSVGIMLIPDGWLTKAKSHK